MSGLLNNSARGLNGTNGKVIWSYKASELNKGTFGTWGIAESPLIDGEKIYFSPGGPETAMIANFHWPDGTFSAFSLFPGYN